MSKWIRRLLDKKQPAKKQSAKKKPVKKHRKKPDPSKMLSPGTGRFVVKTIKDAIISDKEAVREDHRLKKLKQIKKSAAPVVNIAETNKIVHVNYNKSHILVGCYKVRDPITKRFRITKKHGNQRRTTSFYRRDGTVYDGDGEVPQWALDAVTESE